ncbi:uncharacterized protein cubi_02783 [Cryptosporidium ubiquitum]|uniref:Uncharacterized protein n=1 Tax=Cryptosporidium ubiquitum TaxID=857276 RepID=A0A1J4MM98_9CRYT|nr:uncharacterized protein cubi_02783 [Cryptosporidium ubiquitum]OII73981.1 hypothetical protein cubi_02783 [Cryptosporidium ubiquitum]
MIEKKRDKLFGVATSIAKGAEVASSIDSLRPVVTNGIKNETRENKSRWSVDSFGSLDNQETDLSSFGTPITQKGENILINHTKERKLIVSSNCIQLIPKSKYLSLSDTNNKPLEVEKDVRDFQIKEYMIDTMPPEKDQNDLLSKQSNENLIKGEIRDLPLVPNIPFSLFISYFREQRNQTCKKLLSVWRGYKTRSILRGSLRGLPLLEANGDGIVFHTRKVYLGYTIHKILLSIIDLYDLILDEESRASQGCVGGGTNSSSWLDAMYEQVGDFKNKYISEVNSALKEGSGRRWVSDIVNAREANRGDISRKPRERKGLLPMRFENKYKEKILRSKLLLKSNKTVIRKNNMGDQNITKGRGANDIKSLLGGKQEHLSKDEEYINGFSHIYLPYCLVKSNSLEEVSSYLGVKIDQITGIIQEESILNTGNSSSNANNYNSFETESGFELTPGLGRRMGEFTNDNTPFLDRTTPNPLREPNFNMYFTPNSFVQGSYKDQGQDLAEYYTPVQEEFGDPMIENCEYGNEHIEKQGITQKSISQIKPKPYLKRKSKSILPSRETDIELDKVKSKVKELYKGKNLIEKKISRKVPASGGYELSGSRIPNISSTLNIISVSNSPSSRNSSSKVSRIPKYTTVSLNNTFKNSQNSKGVDTPQIIRSRYSDF